MDSDEKHVAEAMLATWTRRALQLGLSPLDVAMAVSQAVGEHDKNPGVLLPATTQARLMTLFGMIEDDVTTAEQSPETASRMLSGIKIWCEVGRNLVAILAAWVAHDGVTTEPNAVAWLPSSGPEPDDDAAHRVTIPDTPTYPGGPDGPLEGGSL